jgi:hypothetical protein
MSNLAVRAPRPGYRDTIAMRIPRRRRYAVAEIILQWLRCQPPEQYYSQYEIHDKIQNSVQCSRVWLLKQLHYLMQNGRIERISIPQRRKAPRYEYRLKRWRG